MIPVLLAGSDKAFIPGFLNAFENNNIQVLQTESGSQAISMVSELDFALLIADEILTDMSGLELVKKLLSMNPMINCALISPLSSEDFHEVSEGLGIIMQLPPEPDKIHGENLLEHLNKILNMTT